MSSAGSLAQKLHELNELLQAAEKRQDFNTITQRIKDAKRSFVTLTCFVPQPLDNNQKMAQVLDELIYVRGVLEVSVMVALLQRDEELFAREFVELESIYLHPLILRQQALSERQALIVALMLTRYLANDDLEAFHILLRRICGKGETEHGETTTFCGVKLTPQDAALLNFPLKLETHIVDGNLLPVLIALQQELPDPRFSVFAAPLAESTRHRMQVALKKAHATTLATQTKDEVPTLSLMKQWLGYATDLEAVI